MQGTQIDVANGEVARTKEESDTSNTISPAPGVGSSPQLSIRLCVALECVVFGPIWSGKKYEVCLRGLENGRYFCTEYVDHKTFSFSSKNVYGRSLTTMVFLLSFIVVQVLPCLNREEGFLQIGRLRVLNRVRVFRLGRLTPTQNMGQAHPSPPFPVQICQRQVLPQIKTQDQHHYFKMSTCRDVFALSENELRKASLVQLPIDTGNNPPVRLRPHRTPQVQRRTRKRDVATQHHARINKAAVHIWQPTPKNNEAILKIRDTNRDPH